MQRYPDPRQLNSYLRSIVANLGAVPGVRDVAITSALPLEGWGYGMPFQIAGQPLVDRANRQDCFFKMVSPSYFRTLGMRVRQGRALSDRDVAGAPPVTVINETMARKYLPNQNPIGKRILIQQIVPGKTQLGPEIAWEVVGVVADERVTDLDEKEASPGIYVTNDQSPAYDQGLVVRASMNPLFLEKAIRKAVYDVNKDQPLTDVKTLEQVKVESMASDRLRSVLLAVFAAHRAGAIGGGDLWRGVLYGGAADERDRHSRGVGRQQRQLAGPGIARRDVDDAGGAGRRIRRLARFCPAAFDASVRSGCLGHSDHRDGGGDFSPGGIDGLLFSRPQGREG